VVEVLRIVGNAVLWDAVVEGAAAELELENVDEPTCRRPKAVASATCAQRRIYIKGSVRLMSERMLGLRQVMPFLLFTSHLRVSVWKYDKGKGKGSKLHRS
jgi:hypothetical protein